MKDSSKKKKGKKCKKSPKEPKVPKAGKGKGEGEGRRNFIKFFSIRVRVDRYGSRKTYVKVKLYY